MLTYKTSLHDALYRHVEENVNPVLVIAEPGESNLYFLSETVVDDMIICCEISKDIKHIYLAIYVISSSPPFCKIFRQINAKERLQRH